MASSRPLSDQDIINNTSRGKDYPSPFFQLSNTVMPDNIKKLFKYCRSFYYTNSFLRNVVSKLTEYPLTEILYSSDTDPNVKEKYDTLLHDKLHINSLLYEIGLDYYVYGNCFISTFLQPKRYLYDPNFPDKLYPIEEIDYKMRDFKFYASHPGQNEQVQMKIYDQFPKNPENFRFVRWAPRNIDIQHNPITGSTKYFYNIPNKIKKKVVKGNKAVVNEIPEIFLDALKKKKAIEIDKSNLYHFKQPTLAEDDMAWGKPPILPALKEIYYLQTLKKGNEAIAHEHTVPKKAISPSSSTKMDPFSQLNMGKWKNKMEDQVKKWRKDPNHIGVFPIPIAYQELGGNAKALLLTPQMKFIEENIINSLGVPIEFVKGGTSWTGSSISLRIVENHFISYRQMLKDFLNNFVVKKLNHKLNMPEVELKFKQFKMSDDARAKQLTLNLASEGKISDETLLDAFGYDAEEEKQAMKQNHEEMMDRQVKDQVRKAEAQGQAQVKLKKYQVKAKMEAQHEQLRQRIKTFQEELDDELGGVPYEPFKFIERMAIKLAYMEPAKQQQRLSRMGRTMPTTQTLVVERLQQILQANSGAQSEPGEEEKEETQREAKDSKVKKEKPNEQTKGQRKQDQMDTTKQKQKANTRGFPNVD